MSLTKRVALFLESIYKKIHRGIARVTGFAKRPMTCEVFHVVEHSRGITAMGRVMRIRKWRKPRPKDHALRNFWQMLQCWMTPERPNTAVKITCGNVVEEILSDREGYFEITLPHDSSVPVGKVQFEIPISDDSATVSRKALMDSEKSRCLIISDIDDTVLITNAARLFAMLATTFFGNALTRQIFKGTSQLYKGLRRGNSDGFDESNPVSYVTSSPYNLHALLSLIFKENGIPGGAFFMTDWGMDEEKWLKLGHEAHKLKSIQKALAWYPNRPAILIGDSGQHDSHIYGRVVKENPGRIAHVLIRCVSDKERIESLKEIWDEAGYDSVAVTFFSTSLEAASALREAGWLDEAALNAVTREFEK